MRIQLFAPKVRMRIRLFALKGLHIRAGGIAPGTHTQLLLSTLKGSHIARGFFDPFRVLRSFCLADLWALPTAITFDAFSVVTASRRQSADIVLYIKEGGRLAGDSINQEAVRGNQ